MRTETQIAASSADRAISAQELAGAKLTVIEGESTDHWQALLEACHREFQPETEIETELVSEVAAVRWRLRRCWSIETSLFDTEIAKLRENPEFEPQDSASQHDSAAQELGQTCGSWTATRPEYGAVPNAFRKTSISSAPQKTENFQTNPRIPANNP